jgi:methylenetetrahydrofolate reductase (NADPH)
MDQQKTRHPDETLIEALQHPRYEVIPVDGIEKDIAEYVPEEIRFTVTASPRKGIEPTIRLAGRLSRMGYRATPHLSARLIDDESHLKAILQSLSETGVNDVFVVAGDRDEPVGKFHDARQLLEAMSEIGHGFGELGITGYPESHPFISDETMIKAMHEKAPYATYIVSQLSFNPRTIAGWVQRVRDRGVDLPIEVGMPGAIDRLKLLRVSKNIGIGESARFLRKHHSRLLRLFLPGGYNPNHLVEELSPSLANPESKVRGFHIYTFNEVDKTEAWRWEELNRLGGSRVRRRKSPR